MKKFLLLILIISSITIAQELDATVIVNYEQLETGARERLVNFQRTVENYLNNAKFTKKEWEGDPIKCSFNIFFSGGTDINYRAQVVVTSQRPIYQSTMNSLMMRIQDGSWSFNYEDGQSMYFNQMDFDPLTSFLDYYAYIIIGFDMDSFYELGGSGNFSQALDISVLGGSSKFKDGWISSSSAFNRRGLVDDLLNAKFQQFRLDYFDYHYNGLDLLSENKLQAQMEIVKLIKNLEKIKSNIDARSVLMKLFFEAKNGEMCDILKDYQDGKIFESLKKIDPQHVAKYNEVLDARNR